MTAGLVATTASPAAAAPGNPGTPSAPTVLYQENFQNGSGVTLLPNYNSTSGVKYTADNYWLDAARCNGFILSYDNTVQPSGYCQGSSDEYDSVRAKAYALGLLNNPQNPTTNRAVSSNTSGFPPGFSSGGIQFATQNQLNLPDANGRFVTFAVDAAATACGAAHPLLRFYLRTSGGAELPVSDSAIDPCSSAGSKTVTVDGREVAYGSFIADGSQLVTGSSLGIVMRNVGAIDAGNDGAFDNIRVLDVTPQMDKSFSPAVQRTGDVSTLTFTVTNTSELGAKRGWGFTDDLPTGLVLASSSVGGTCDAVTSAQAGGTRIRAADGNLAKGETSCTITVQVTSTQAGAYDNCPTTNVTTTSLNAPACARVEFFDPTYTVSKTADKTTAKQGDTVNYTVTVKNTGRVDYSAARPATFTDDLSKVLDDATYNNDASNGATVSGNTLSWSGALAAGEMKTITYSVKVNNPDAGDKQLDNIVAPDTSIGGDCDPDLTCATSTPVQAFTIEKSVDRATVIPGQKVTYTVTLTNTGKVAYTAQNAAAFTDDLSAVTDDATYNNDATNGAVVSGNTLSWSGPLAIGATQTITYSFTVNDPVTGDQQLTNAVTPNDPSACQGKCTTTVPNQGYTVAKSVDKTMLNPGDTATYTVTVRNTGRVAFTAQDPASFTDDLSKVTDDATYNNDATNGADVNGNTLSWSGALAVGETKTIVYSFKVNNPDTGDKVLDNAVTPTSPAGNCIGACTTSTPVQTYKVEKSADKSEVNPGDVVTYTITVTNTGKAAYTDQRPASFTDDLSKVADDATYNNDATNGAIVNGNTVSWSGALAVGESKTIVYSFTVDTPDTGDKVLENAVVPTGPGSDPPPPPIVVPVQTYKVEKSADKSEVNPGDVVTYTITVTNTGKAAYTDQRPASFTDDLSKVADDATYNNDATNGAIVNGNTVSWSGALAVGESKTIVYSFTVDTPDTGDKVLENAVVPTGPGSDPPPPPIVVPVQTYKVEKSADKSEVNPGDVVTYTITVTNTGKAAYTDQRPASFTDDLSKVADDATYNNDAINGATVNGNTVSWSGALAVGESKTIVYSFTVDTPDTGDKVLENAVVPTGPGSDPPPPPAVTKVQTYKVDKTADKAAVGAGDTVTYTITVTNTGEVDYTAEKPASFTDDLSKVTDDAVYNDDATNGAVVEGNTLSWSGTLAVGETKTIVYSVTVNNPDTGDKVLENAVVPTGPGSDTPPPPVVIPVLSYTVDKTGDKTEVNPGDVVTYTVTVTNTGEGAYTAEAPASFTDDLSKVTDDATYNGDATNGATVDGNTLSWAGPLAVGETKTISYSVTVNTPDQGDKMLENAVVPTGPGKQITPPPPFVTKVGTYAVEKAVDKTLAKSGDRVTYTITVRNTGQVDYTADKPASFTDDLSKVTDDASYNGDATDGAVVDGNTLSWKGALAIGETKTIVYSFTVNSPDRGDKVLTNVVTPTGPGGGCAGVCKTTTNTTPPPAGPAAATGGTILVSAPAWPWIGLGAIGFAVLIALGITRARRARLDATDED